MDFSSVAPVRGTTLGDLTPEQLTLLATVADIRASMIESGLYGGDSRTVLTRCIVLATEFLDFLNQKWDGTYKEGIEWFVAEKLHQGSSVKI